MLSSYNNSSCSEKENIIGLVTLENVIERILLIDIHDEKDREVTVKMLQKKATIVHSNSN
jgi:CBS domain containing-hemolysin-like protein